MKILLINGSPKGKKSNSLRLAASFVEGVKSKAEGKGDVVTLDEVEVASLKIAACRGCFACWKKTPGHCCIKDDMASIIEKEIEADLVVWSFPLYYFNVPGILKNLIDRQLPMSLPFMSENTNETGSGGHDARYDMKNIRHVLISTCGFYSAKGNYDSVINMFDHFLGKGNYETIFCGQGELFRVDELSDRINQYLEIVKKAGSEYADGKISDEVSAQLRRLLYPKEIFEKLADADWGINKETGEKEAEDLTFTRQMAALYNKNFFRGKNRVLEMCYTDTGHTYQILLTKDGSELFTDGSLKATTRVETPFEVWVAISRGEMEGAEALGKKLYRVDGDFSLMMDWDKIFGSDAVGSGEEYNEGTGADKTGLKNPSMTSMLLPWISFWVAVAINPIVGPIAAMALCALVPFIMRKHKLIIWDQLSIAAVALLSAAAHFTGKGEVATNVGYLIFGLFWLASCFTKEPLCASYVKYSYGGSKAERNPLFMSANYILAACWGCLYIFTAIWTFFLRRAGFGNILIVVNNLVPLAMGLFTGWFVKWYPAWKARG